MKMLVTKLDEIKAPVIYMVRLGEDRHFKVFSSSRALFKK